MTHHSTWKIIARHTFTLFNLVNLLLALMIISVGSYKNMLFVFIAIANTLIGVINDLRAKKIVDKLKLLSEKPPIILKNGTPTEVLAAKVHPGDTLVLTLGDQVLFDSRLKTGAIEVNESFITGEQDTITKHPGDTLISGSFVVAGSGEATVTHAQEDNFVAKLQSEARSIHTADSKLFALMNKIVKYISWSLIPVGALLLWSRLRTEPSTTDAVTSTVAALINMIPEGLILLTSSVLALATIRLGRQKVLVQDLYAIETLARVDTICLDKTGTLTTGNMTVKDYTAFEKSFETVLASLLSHQTSENATTSALKRKFLKGAKFREIDDITEIIPFSSDRKYSGIKTKDATYLMGAIDFITDDAELIAKVKTLSGNYRTIAVVENGHILGIVRLEDELRPTAKKIIKYFYDNDISVKIISGDDLAAVTSIAEKVGVKDLRGVSLSGIKKPNYESLVENYSIFTRVTPEQKKHLITTLKKQGSTVAMTGDGVNDILAMKEADASIAIGAGSDAASRAAKFVLLDSGFEAIPAIIDEGRQSINNLERSTTLFLTKTVYAVILAVLFVFLPLSYPFTPIEMTLISVTCIGLPGLALALEKNTARIKNQFITNITKYSIPTGIIISLACLFLSILAHFNNFTRPELATVAVLTTFSIHLALIYQISRPLNKFRTALIIIIVAIVAAAFLTPVINSFFEFTHFNI